jgi:hypothetical protein
MSDELSIQRLARRLYNPLQGWGFIVPQSGTYVPTYDGVTPGATTYTTQVGFWRRVGDIIFFNGRVTWTAASGTGAAVVSLPFTSQNTANMRYAVGVYLTNVTFANGAVQATIVPNSAVFSMSSALTNAAPTNVNVEAAGDIIFSGWFVL